MAKKITSFDVAKRAGVSRSVVSAVLNGTAGIRVGEQTRQAVLQAIEELGYRVDAQARGMRLGRSECIAAYGRLDNPFFLEMMKGFQARCAGSGYHVLLYGARPESDSREELIELFLQRRIDGIVTKDTTGFADLAWAERVRRHRIPFVSVEGYPETDAVASVLMDYRASVREALDYATRQTGLVPVYLEVYAGDAYRPNWGDRERLQSYLEWMAERSREPEVWTCHERELGPEPSTLAERLAGYRGPLCLLANWSRGARAALRAAQALDRQVGRDLYLLACDNTEQVNQHLIPSLSAVEVPYEEMGSLAAERLIEYIEGRRSLQDTGSIRAAHRFMPRESL